MVQLFIRPYKHILGEVLGISEIAGRVAANSPDHRCIPIIELPVSRLLAGQYGFYQVSVFRSRQFWALMTDSTNIVTGRRSLSTGILRFFVPRPVPA